MTDDIEKECDTCQWRDLGDTEKPCSYCYYDYSEWTSPKSMITLELTETEAAKLADLLYNEAFRDDDMDRVHEKLREKL